MVCKCDLLNYDKFIAGVFNECITGANQISSFIFGWISICAWLIAMYPQIRMNFLLRKSEALSAQLVIMWIAGDICNAISCFVLDQLFTQKILGMFWLVIDIFLLITHFYFLHTKKQYTSLQTHFRALEIFIYVTVIIVIVNNISWAGCYGRELLIIDDTQYDICKKSTNFDSKSFRYIFGNILAYLTIPCYCLSRPGQIVKNFKRKSTMGLSIGMFLSASTGNITQLISLLSMSQEKQYLITKAPYIVATIIPALCDIVVIIQICLYGEGKYNTPDELNKLTDQETTE